MCGARNRTGRQPRNFRRMESPKVRDPATATRTNSQKEMLQNGV
jgi:hypothetical protein